MSATTIAIHLFGDVPAPPLAGALQDSLDSGNGGDRDNWRTTFGAVSCALLAAAVLFHAAARVALREESRAAGGGEGDMDEGGSSEEERPLLF
jgi:hypothetical protein